VDPIDLFGDFLTRIGLLDSPAVEAMERDIRSEIADAFAFALASANPTEKDLYRHVYAD
jgi:TPP-dependent pyruvate/acetoin dehydrogenase alpha subunit